MDHVSTCDKLCCYLLYFFSACFTILPHGLMRSSVIFMGGCIEMKGIHHILHTLDRALCHDINILVPMRTAHQDDIIRIILSDFRDDGFSVYLQICLSQQFCSGLISATELKEIAFYQNISPFSCSSSKRSPFWASCASYCAWAARC